MVYWLCFFFKQKTAYEMRISDWSSDVCSSDLVMATARASLTGRLRSALRIASGVVPNIGAAVLVASSHTAAGPVADADGMVWSTRSEERSVGKECVSTCRSRWSAYH